MEQVLKKRLLVYIIIDLTAFFGPSVCFNLVTYHYRIFPPAYVGFLIQMLSGLFGLELIHKHYAQEGPWAIVSSTPRDKILFIITLTLCLLSASISNLVPATWLGMAMIVCGTSVSFWILFKFGTQRVRNWLRFMPYAKR